MDFFTGIVELFLHLDRHLNDIFLNYGGWTYAILFLIIFAETGLVIAPFLPGDSLLFAVGALAARGSLDPIWLSILLTAAAIIGDSVNYAIGKTIGPRAFANPKSRILRKEYLDRTHRFYEKYGGRTIILARFVPIVRTFAPFVAGVGTMSYRRFMSFNVIGGLAWVLIFVWGGYLFGNIPVVQRNFSIVILAIIVLSVLPIGIEWFRARGESRSAA